MLVEEYVSLGISLVALVISLFTFAKAKQWL